MRYYLFNLIVVIIIVNLFSYNIYTKRNTQRADNSIISTHVQINADTLSAQQNSKAPKFSLNLGEELFLVANQDSFRFKLGLKKLSDDTIFCKFLMYSNDSLIFNNLDTVIRIKKTSSSHEGKYGFSCRGLLYKKVTSSEKIRLVIAKENVKCVGYYLSIMKDDSPFYSWNRNRIKIPIFFIPDVEEPYKEYLHNSLKEFRFAKYQLAKYQLNKIHPDKLFIKNYNNKKNQFLELIQYLDSNTTSYNYINDTSLLDEALYYGLDSISNLLIKKGLYYRRLVPTNTIQKVHIDSITLLNALVKFDSKGQLVSKRFEKISFNQNSNRNYISPIGYVQFSTLKNGLIEFDNKILIIMVDNGFENIGYLLPVWHKEGGYYYLDNILRKVFHVGIGGIHIEKILKIDDANYMITGTTSGGDGGQTWGSFWIGLYSIPDSLKIIYEIERFGEELSDDEFRDEYIDHKIVINDSLIYLRKGVKFYKDNSETDSIILQDTIRYFDLINNNK
ncbi:MAG: hypothetical protein GXO79_11050 [Chlorobi bacterium]|nr:hypothetical protein [Chlorobiota bacterium]